VAHPFFTIGHSTRSLAVFVNLLRSAEVKCLIDVRTVPRSRTNPQFNGDGIGESLAERAILYQQIPELGGRRSRARDVPQSTNAFWENESFHNYADYAMSPAFHSGLARLRELGHRECCAIMCAEALWWRCHRRIITDYLITAGETVFHIIGPKHIEPAKRSDAAKPGPRGTLVYPAQPLLL